MRGTRGDGFWDGYYFRPRLLIDDLNYHREYERGEKASYNEFIEKQKEKRMQEMFFKNPLDRYKIDKW